MHSVRIKKRVGSNSISSEWLKRESLFVNYVQQLIKFGFKSRIVLNKSLMVKIFKINSILVHVIFLGHWFRAIKSQLQILFDILDLFLRPQVKDAKSLFYLKDLILLDRTSIPRLRNQKQLMVRWLKNWKP